MFVGFVTNIRYGYTIDLEFCSSHIIFRIYDDLWHIFAAIVCKTLRMHYEPQSQGRLRMKSLSCTWAEWKRSTLQIAITINVTALTWVQVLESCLDHFSFCKISKTWITNKHVNKQTKKSSKLHIPQSDLEKRHSNECVLFYSYIGEALLLLRNKWKVHLFGREPT